MWSVTLSFIMAIMTPPCPGFPLKNICLIRLWNAICAGRDKVVPGHTLNISSLCNNGECSHRSTHTHMLTRAHTRSLSPDNSRTGSPLINLQHKYTQTAAAADRNWDLEWVAENQKVQIQWRVFTPPSISTFAISLPCTKNTNGQGSHSHAALMIYSYGK